MKRLGIVFLSLPEYTLVCHIGSMKKPLIALCGVLFALIITEIFLRHSKVPTPPSATSTPTATAAPQVPTATPSPASIYADPIADFQPRITKKFFGTYVTPQNSPVQPERFTGYHTGVDIEYGDITTDVPVFAIADGSVVLSEWVSGYGGLVVIHHPNTDPPIYSVYGHLRPSSLIALHASVKKGQQIAVLGTAYSHETDGERRHLHFGIVVSSAMNIKGYAPTKAGLSDWEDPLNLYK